MKILLVDDDKNILRTLSATLKGWGHDVCSASTAGDATQALKNEVFDFMLTDYRLEAKSGLDLIRSAKQSPTPPIMAVMTAYASFENAVDAIKEGAYDYLPKPFSNAQLEHLLNRARALVDLQQENRRLRSSQYRNDYFNGFTSPAMVRLEEFVRKVGPTDATVLLIGESGTGKTELARLIHALSLRASKPFSVVSCTTLAETLLESELFGHVRGAFTGATHEHIGKLEMANHGTILIDEIGDLSLNGQARLLRFLQERVIERVGGTTTIPLDVRIIAATNRDLDEEVKEGKFREDLYFRLNTFECALVPLRFRREDLPILIDRIFREQLAFSGVKEARSVPEPVLKLFLSYSWPGNIRELKNTLERVVLLARDREITPEDLPDPVRVGRIGRSSKSPMGPIPTLEELEREHIERVLAIESNQEKAAELLGITTVTLWRKRKQYGLP